MLKLTQNGAADISITWTRKDDPRGWLAQAVSLGHLEDALRAIGDPMELANVAADDRQAKEELRSVAWMLDQLQKRQNALIVALKDRREEDPDNQAGASWTDLVMLLDPEETEPLKKRSKVQALYNAGRRKAGLSEK